MNFPAELKYSKSHEWVRMDGEIAVVGISDFCLLYTSPSPRDA